MHLVGHCREAELLWKTRRSESRATERLDDRVDRHLVLQCCCLLTELSPELWEAAAESASAVGQEEAQEQ